MNKEFNYKVGDRLTTTAVRQGMISHGPHRVDVPIILTVLERRRNDCSASPPLIYLCRGTNVGYTASIFTDLVQFYECELTDDLSSVYPPENKEENVTKKTIKRLQDFAHTKGRRIDFYPEGNIYGSDDKGGAIIEYTIDTLFEAMARANNA